jgi:hypothetical protein
MMEKAVYARTPSSVNRADLLKKIARSPAYLPGSAVVGMNFQFRHQKKIEDAVILVRLKYDYRAPRLRLGDKIRMGNLELPAVGHVDREWPKGLRADCRPELLSGHTPVLPATEPNHKKRCPSAAVPR